MFRKKKYMNSSTRYGKKKNNKIKLIIFNIIIIGIAGTVGYYVYMNSLTTKILKDLTYTETAINTIKKNELSVIIKNESLYTDVLNDIFESESFDASYFSIYREIETDYTFDYAKYVKELKEKFGYNDKAVADLVSSLPERELLQLLIGAKITYLNDIVEASNYKEENLNDYVKYVSAVVGSEEEYTGQIEEAMTMVNIGVDDPPYTDLIIIDNPDDYLVLVNKYYALGSDYEPSDLIVVSEPKWPERAEQGNTLLRETAADAYMKMRNKAAEEGLTIILHSAYRSYDSQDEAYEYLKGVYGSSQVDNYAARPGSSEHQTGLAVNVCSPYDCFIKGNNFSDTDEYQWLLENAHKYGFILRYPSDRENLTQYSFEAHYRYVGVEAATYIVENDLILEQYILDNY